MKFFHLKIALGLALGESWPLLAQPQKNTDVHKRMLLWEIGENKDVNSSIIFRLLYYTTMRLREKTCTLERNTMALIQTS